MEEKESNLKKQKIVRALISCGVIAIIFLAIYLPLKLTGSLEKIGNLENLKQVLSTSAYSYVLFFVVQFVQVVFLPIPAMVTTLAGVFVFGPLNAFFLSLTSVIFASIVAFLLGRRYGKKMLVWVLGQEEADKWQATLSKGKYMFFLMMLFPGFPDDVLCMVAGASKISFKFFLGTNLITRPIVFAGICFFASGLIIPFSGWGIPVWIVLGVIMAALLILSIVYQSKIEKFLKRFAEKLKNAFSKNKNN